MKVLYFDPIFGISGDMTISAFIDAGLPLDEIKGLLGKLPIKIPEIRLERKRAGAIEAAMLLIEDSSLHFTIKEMEAMIEAVGANEKIVSDARGMLDIMVEAEARVHGLSRDALHLHELSHIDTLIDLLGVAKAMDYFKIEKAFSGPVPLGSGVITTAHGVMPNPPPATMEILSAHKVVFLEEPFELTTPTGAAIIRYYTEEGIRPPPLRIEGIGYGAGSYEGSRPDLLRIFIGEADEPFLAYDEEVWVIESDIDDMEMEFTGAIAERLREAGALDVVYFPIYMKKGRIGLRLSVTTPIQDIERVLDMVFLETSTFGVRLNMEKRRVLKREEQILDTEWGHIRIKRGYDISGRLIKSHIEFDDIRRICDSKHIPYRQFLDTIKKVIF